MKMNYNIVALIGPAGTGKDTLLSKIVDADPQTFHRIIKSTTRPKRENEQPEVDYHFLSSGDFAKKIINNQILEAEAYREWVYGTEFTDLDSTKINVGVFTPTSLETIKYHSNIHIITYALAVSDKERLLRQLNRESEPDIDEIFRRFKADKEDFYDLSDLKPIHYISNETLTDMERNVYTIITTSKKAFLS